MKKAFVGLFVAAALAPAALGQILADNFDGYADQAAFQTAWTPIGANSATLASDQSHSAPNSVFAMTTANSTGGNTFGPVTLTGGNSSATGGTNGDVTATGGGGFGGAGGNATNGDQTSTNNSTATNGDQTFTPTLTNSATGGSNVFATLNALAQEILHRFHRTTGTRATPAPAPAPPPAPPRESLPRRMAQSPALSS